MDGAAQAIALLNRSGYLVFVVTNQSGIGRGYFTEDDFAAVTAHMNGLLAEHGAHVDDIRFCAHHPDAELHRYRADHPWRKPAPGMILDLLARWDVNVASSFLIGDSPRDVEAARAAGIEGFLFQGGGNLLDFLNAIKPGIGHS